MNASQPNGQDLWNPYLSSTSSQVQIPNIQNSIANGPPLRTPDIQMKAKLEAPEPLPLFKVEEDECNMSTNFKNAVAARNNFMIEEDEGDVQEKIDDPWVVKDLQLELTDKEKELFQLLE